MDAPKDSPDRPPGIWFPAKRYGWGWGPPVRWQGWAVLIGWLVIFVCLAPIVVRYGWLALIGFEVPMVALLIGICWAKGEKSGWRWGK
jgi:hypothetical protein